MPGAHPVTSHLVRYPCLSPLTPMPRRIGGRCSFPWAGRFCFVRKSKAFLLWKNTERKKGAMKALRGSLPSDGVIYSFTHCHQSGVLCSLISRASPAPGPGSGRSRSSAGESASLRWRLGLGRGLFLHVKESKCAITWNILLSMSANT